MNPPLIAVSIGLGVAFCATGANAQPNVVPELKTQRPALSLAELEKFLGGRTLLSLDVKDATLAEVAAAMSQTSGQKIVLRTPREGTALPAVEPPIWTLQSAPKPFWEALREMQLQARHAANLTSLGAPMLPFRRATPPNSVGLQKTKDGWSLESNANLVGGRAVAAWPFLILATDIRRSQEARLSENGLDEIQILPNFRGPGGRFQLGAELAARATTPVSEEKRWRDQLILDGKVFYDPKIAFSRIRCEVLEALDDKGNDLRLSKEEEIGNFNGTSYPADRVLRIPLRSKPAMGKRLVKLRGEFRFSVVTRSQHWETTQLNTPIGATVFRNGREVDVQFKGLQKRGDQWVANFTAESRGFTLEKIWEDVVGWPRPINGTAGILSFEGTSGMQIVDEDGQVYDSYASGSQRISWFKDEDPNDVAFSNGSPPPPDLAQNWRVEEQKIVAFGPKFDDATGGNVTLKRPVKLILDLPIERREVVVPFEFTDLSLPPS